MEIITTLMLITGALMFIILWMDDDGPQSPDIYNTLKFFGNKLKKAGKRLRYKRKPKKKKEKKEDKISMWN